MSLLAPPLRVENPCTVHGSFVSVGATRIVARPVTRFAQAAVELLLAPAARTDFFRALDVFGLARRILDGVLIGVC